MTAAASRTLTVVTDHRFYVRDGTVVGASSLDREFFQDYAAVFDQVLVAARVSSSTPPPNAVPAEGSGVAFVPLPDLRGARWAMGSMSVRAPLGEALDSAHAVCLRLPSVAGSLAAQIAMSRRLPMMFELAGDPGRALQFRDAGLLAWIYGRLDALRVKRIVRHARVGSYVSRRHLQQRYPAKPSALTDSISSIRLPSHKMRPPLQLTSLPTVIRLVSVGGLVPVKRHDVTIAAVADAVDRGANVSLKIFGEGTERPRLEALIRKLGVERIAELKGHIAGPDRVMSELQTCHLFVSSSASEGLPRAMLEAMATGLPALGSDVPGIAELLPSDQRFQSRSVARLADLLVRFCSSVDLLNVAAQRSAAVVREFDQERLAERRRRLLAVLLAAT